VSRLGRFVAAPLLSLVLAAACGGGDRDDVDADAADDASVLVANDVRCLDADESAAPRVDLIADAIAASTLQYGSEQRFFEISADRQRVSLIVSTADGAAEQSFFCGDDGYGAPESLGPADGATFGAAEVDLDPDLVLSGVTEELPDAEIIDFVVQGAPDGVIYDATLLSDAGGTILVLLGRDGEVLAVQAS
jgi:hypothetical protein